MNLVPLVEAGWWILSGYLVMGVVFTAAFQIRGFQRIDSAAQNGGIGFRLLITPGLIALWPMMAGRWFVPRGMPSPEAPISPRRSRGIHAVAWWVLLVVIPLLFVTGLLWHPKEVAARREASGLKSSFTPSSQP